MFHAARPGLRGKTASLTLALAMAVSGLGMERAALAADPALSLDLGGGVHLDLVLVRAGTFTQGSPPGEQGRGADETSRQVTLSRDFCIGKTPVTLGQFKRFTAESGYKTEAERGSSGGYGWDGKALVQRKEFTWQNPGFEQADDSPVVLVTYDDAQAFNDWLARKSGRRIELPTEAQFEYAERGGTRTRYYGGDDDAAAGRIGWFSGNAGNGTRKVGQKQPNELGLFDMAGNVWEWCRDYYGPYDPGPVTDPLLTTSPSTEDKPRRVLRGGSWLKDAKNLRSAARYRNAPGSRNADNGFRIVASLDAQPPAATAPPASPTGSPPADGPGGKKAADFNAGVGVCITLPAIGLILLIVILILKMRSSSGSGGGSGGGAGGGRHGISWVVAPDGFVLRAPPHLRGKRVFYRQMSHGRWVPGAIVLDGNPGGQFVYTGSAPVRVDIERVESFQPPFGGSGAYVEPSGTGYSGGSSMGYAARRDDDREPFRGYPSAY